MDDSSASLEANKTRSAVRRLTLDYNANIVNYMRNRVYQRGFGPPLKYQSHLPTPDAVPEFEPVFTTRENPSIAYCTVVLLSFILAKIRTAEILHRKIHQNSCSALFGRCSYGKRAPASKM